MIKQLNLSGRITEETLPLLLQPWQNSPKALDVLRKHPPNIILQLYAQGSPEVETKYGPHVENCDRCAKKLDYLRDMAKKELIN